MNNPITVDNLLDLAPDALAHGNVDLLDAIELVARHMANRGVTMLIHHGGCSPQALAAVSPMPTGALSLTEAEHRVFSALCLRETTRMFRDAAPAVPIAIA